MASLSLSMREQEIRTVAGAGGSRGEGAERDSHFIASAMASSLLSLTVCLPASPTRDRSTARLADTEGVSGDGRGVGVSDANEKQGPTHSSSSAQAAVQLLLLQPPLSGACVRADCKLFRRNSLFPPLTMVLLILSLSLSLTLEEDPLSRKI